MSNDDDDDIRAMVHRAAVSIDVDDRESEILSGAASGRRRTQGRLVPLTIAAAIAAILVVVALIRTAGSGPTDGSPSVGAVTTTSQESSPSLPPSSGEVSAGASEDGWTAGPEISTAVKNGVPVAGLRAIASRTAQLLQSADLDGLIQLQRPDLVQRTRTADVIKDLGGHPTRLTLYFEADQPEDRFVKVAYSIDCETPGLRVSPTLTFGRSGGAWYLNLATGIGGIVTQDVDTTTDPSPSTSQMLSCEGP